MRLPNWIAQHLAALRALLIFTVLLGLAYPLALVGVARLPGLADKAQGSLVSGADGSPVGSKIIGQPFVDTDGNPLPQYFHPPPRRTTPPLGATSPKLGHPSVTTPASTQVCPQPRVGHSRRPSRPFCTSDGVGAVLRVFRSEGLTGTVTRAVSVNQACPATPFITSYEGVTVECAQPGEDYSGGGLMPVRGGAAARSAVPADAVTASGSGLDPHISPAYAELQIARVARERARIPRAYASWWRSTPRAGRLVF